MKNKRIAKAIIILILSFILKMVMWLVELISAFIWLVAALINVIKITLANFNKTMDEEVIKKLVEWQSQ
jgi:hypothetical protein